MDWRPPGGGSFLALGARTIGRGESISENTKTTGYFEFSHAYGNAFDNERNKPYDSFDMTIQFNFGDKVPLGQAQVVGTLYKKALGDDAHPDHVFEIAQHFDYMNNEDYEFGGQSFGPVSPLPLRSRQPLEHQHARGRHGDGPRRHQLRIREDRPGRRPRAAARIRLRAGAGRGGQGHAVPRRAAAAPGRLPLPVDQREQRLRLQQRPARDQHQRRALHPDGGCAPDPAHQGELRHRRGRDRLLPREPVFARPCSRTSTSATRRCAST